MSAGSSRTMKTSVGVEKANFFVHYECDDETVKHVLKLDGYDGDEEECWVQRRLKCRTQRYNRTLLRACLSCISGWADSVTRECVNRLV